MMRRREFLGVLGGAASVWPVTVSAQQSAPPVIGFLSARSPEDTPHLVEAFRRGLGEIGFIEGQNVKVEYRWALGEHKRLPELAADLVHMPVTVLVSTGGDTAALAAKGATSTIPIAFIIGGDPVKLGLAASYNRPGANSTGIAILTVSLEPKRLELLRELAPKALLIGAFLDPASAPYESQLRDMREAAGILGIQIEELRASTDAEIEAGFETVARQRIGAVAVAAGPFFDTRRDKFVALAARYAVPTMYHFREFTTAGGLISYGVDSRVTYRQIGIYTGAILKGEKPAELPVLQPTRFELVINLKTAKALGLSVAPKLLALADEVIE